MCQNDCIGVPFLVVKNNNVRRTFYLAIGGWFKNEKENHLIPKKKLINLFELLRVISDELERDMSEIINLENNEINQKMLNSCIVRTLGASLDNFIRENAPGENDFERRRYFLYSCYNILVNGMN